jgi:oxygen-dependent protoporphyrinogen oxidase
VATELAAIEYVSTATVFFGLEREHVRHDLDGFGFIVPDGEARILAATWVSSKWDERAPRDGALVRAFLGGARDPGLVLRASDEELVGLARGELERFMGSLGEPRLTRVHRFAAAGPQPAVGHVDRIRRVRERLARFRGLAVAGAAYDGVGIPDCVRQARDAARAVLGSI